MANSETGTSTSNTLGAEYQVFLNFRGSDTRRGFTDSLYHALVDVGIHVFIDNEELSPGERIRDNLLRAIDDSKLYIPIFSKNYASSHWCLRELAKMVENTIIPKEGGNMKVILPIFYDVKPDDVKLKTTLYKEAILNLEQQMEDQKKKFSSDEVETWRKALKEVDGFKGWELEEYQGDGELTKLIVHEVLVKLKTRQRPVTKILVGMDDHVLAIKNLLDIDSGGVRLIGIYGMGGIGKTTLAKMIFNQLCPRFGKYCSFLDDVRETAKSKGLVELQRKLLSDISRPRAAQNIGNNTIGETICNKEVLVVLDDVNDGNQIINLIGGNSLYRGTRILITTRDKSIRKIRGLKYEILPYEMEGLNEQDALRLFSRYAFDDDSPPADYYTLSESIVSTTDGLPLALEVIGASFYGEENKKIWKERLKKLKETPDAEVSGKLRISYDALQPNQQQIFLDIACFFVGENKTNPMYVWEVCKLWPEHAIEVLIKRSMIKDLEADRFRMHDQLRDLGRTIVKDEGTRLWDQSDIICKLRSIEVKERVLALRLASWGLSQPHLTVTSEQIKRFPCMRFLWLSEVVCQGDFRGCLSELRWIDLNYPYSVPPRRFGCHQWFEATNSLQLENVVVVKLTGLDITEDVFENLMKGATKLKVLDLRYNESIHGTLTFPTYSLLEKLAISKFLSLMEIDCSIGKLRWLIDLSFESCWDLQKLPDQIGELQNLRHLSLRGCHSLSELPDSVSKLKSLTNLDVSQTAITRLPDKIGRLPSLSSADVSFTPIAEMPSTTRKFRQLKTLDLDCCHDIQVLPELPKSLTTLRLRSTSLLTIPNLSYLTDLVELVLSDGSDLKARSNVIQTCDLWWIGRLSKLSKLRFCFSNVRAPTTELGSLSLLRELTLYGLDLPTFKQLPSNLIVLELYDTQGKQVHLEGLPQLEKETDTQGKQVHLEGLPQLEKEKETDTRGKQAHLDGLPQLEKEKETDTRGKQIHLEGLPQLEKEKEKEKETDTRGKQVHLDGLPQLEKEKETDTRGKKVHLDGLPRLEKETAFDSTSSRKSRGNENTYRMHLERQFLHEIDSLETSRIMAARSRKRLVSPPKEPGCNELQAPKLIDHRRGAFLFPNSQKMLKKFILSGFPEVQDIQFVSAFVSLEEFYVEECSSLKSLGGLSNLKNLKDLSIIGCTSLQVVEGIDKLEYLHWLKIIGCISMERIFDASSSKIPNECQIHIRYSGELLDCGQSIIPWESYRDKIMNGIKQASDSEIETTDSETETGDPLQKTNRENEEKKRTRETESVSDHESHWD